MIFLFLFVVFVIVTASIWFQGLWSAAITLINLLLAMMIATNLYEPICGLIEGFGAGSWTYLLDFVVLWLVFFLTFAVLRLFTDLLSRTRVKFELPVEMAGRSLLAVWCGWLMVSFVAFSMQMAPLNSANPLGAWSSPSSRTFLVASPERLWMRYMYSRSRGALARGHAAGPVHPDDESLNVQAFDPLAELPLKYRDRRVKYVAEEQMRVARE
jgi:hypothetical protein